MRKLFLDIVMEFKQVLLGKSLDILIPPLLFLVLNNVYGILSALVGSLLLSIIITIYRILRRENIYYAVGGLIAVVIAISLALLGNNASNFFLPDIVGTLLLVLVTIVSLLVKKPLAMWVSHITRGWDLNWFYRSDIKPAYTNVTIFWLVFFILRLFVEIYLYLFSSVEELVIANIIMGLPLLITVLTISYIYGIIKLRSMKGPGIDEFVEGKEPPYKGQRRGF